MAYIYCPVVMCPVYYFPYPNYYSNNPQKNQIPTTNDLEDDEEYDEYNDDDEIENEQQDFVSPIKIENNENRIFDKLNQQYQQEDDQILRDFDDFQFDPDEMVLFDDDVLHPEEIEESSKTTKTSSFVTSKQDQITIDPIPSSNFEKQNSEMKKLELSIPSFNEIENDEKTALLLSEPAHNAATDIQEKPILEVSNSISYDFIARPANPRITEQVSNILIETLQGQYVKYELAEYAAKKINDKIEGSYKIAYDCICYLLRGKYCTFEFATFCANRISKKISRSRQ